MTLTFEDIVEDLRPYVEAENENEWEIADRLVRACKMGKQEDDMSKEKTLKSLANALGKSHYRFENFERTASRWTPELRRPYVEGGLNEAHLRRCINNGQADIDLAEEALNNGWTVQQIDAHKKLPQMFEKLAKDIGDIMGIASTKQQAVLQQMLKMMSNLWR